MNERPRSVTVFAVINLIMSLLGVLFLTWNLVLRLGLLTFPGMEDTPRHQLMLNNVGYRLMSDVMTGLGFITTIIIIAASIGMFMLKHWARLATIGWGIYAIISGLLMAGVDHVLVVNPTLEQYAGKPEYSFVVGSIVFGYVLAGLFFGYYLLMIFMLMRRHVVQAFTPEPPDELYNEPGLPPAESGGTPR